MLAVTDLDNTLIFSYKRYQQGICVETKEGRSLSYMTADAYHLLQKLVSCKKNFVIPITTRSLEQYQRLCLLEQQTFELALTSNGAVLLHKGREDHAWRKESQALMADAVDELEKALVYLHQEANITLEPRFVDGSFVYTKSNQVEKTMENLKQQIDLDKVFIDNNGEKLYVFPKELTKGRALQRLHHRFGQTYTIAAGDSWFDLSMLQGADTAIIPKNSMLLAALTEHNDVRCSDLSGERFAEFVLHNISEMEQKFLAEELYNKAYSG